jgi:hypothetical protein
MNQQEYLAAAAQATKRGDKWRRLRDGTEAYIEARLGQHGLLLLTVEGRRLTLMDMYLARQYAPVA